MTKADKERLVQLMAEMEDDIQPFAFWLGDLCQAMEQKYNG